MSTRSLTHIHEDGQILMTFYRQSDGYPEGHGADLAEFLAGLYIVNGMSAETVNKANGMGCLAAQLVRRFKAGPGGIYIYPAGSKDCGEAYTYNVRIGKEVSIPNGRGVREANMIEMSVTDYDGKELFNGAPADFPAFVAALAAAKQ